MFTPENSILVVIDMQGKLARLMHNKDELIRNISVLIDSALALDIPIFITEQAPEKIGATIPDITKNIKHYDPIVKSSFSCCQERRFIEKLQALGRNNIIISGIEAHVCVYQTASDLLKKGYDVQIIADAVSSRSEANKKIAMHRMEQSGCQMTCAEMAVCELLQSCKHPKFKEIMSLIK